MLAQVGYGSLDELTAAAVPDVIKNAEALELPGARTEAEVLAELAALGPQPGARLDDRPRLLRHVHAAGDPAQRHGEPGLVRRR